MPNSIWRDHFPKGFDVNIAGSHIGHPASYFYPYGDPKHTHRVPGRQEHGQDGEYLTDRLTEEACASIRARKDGPFFLYLAHYAVHAPLQGKKDLVEEYASQQTPAEQKNAVYAAMVQSVDESSGSILKTLEASGIADNTVIVFNSDNGGLWPQSTSNAPLRAGKGFPYEGGIRYQCNSHRFQNPQHIVRRH